MSTEAFGDTPYPKVDISYFKILGTSRSSGLDGIFGPSYGLGCVNFEKIYF